MTSLHVAAAVVPPLALIVGLQMLVSIPAVLLAIVLGFEP
jgi:hypothetical protein